MKYIKLFEQFINEGLHNPELDDRDHFKLLKKLARPAGGEVQFVSLDNDNVLGYDGKNYPDKYLRRYSHMRKLWYYPKGMEENGWELRAEMVWPDKTKPITHNYYIDPINKKGSSTKVLTADETFNEFIKLSK